MKIVLLCNSHLSSFDVAVLQYIEQQGTLALAGAVINTKRKPGAWSRIKRELKKGRGGYVIIQIVQALLKKAKGDRAEPAEKFFSERALPFFKASSLYNDEVYQWIRSHHADCLLLRGFGIIKEPVLSIAPYGVISYHHGDLLKFRGGPPVFWELYHGETQVGVTIQVLDEGLDTGTIVLQKFIPVKTSDSWESLRTRVYRESVSMAAEALVKLKQSGPLKKPAGAVGKLYTLPNLRQWLYLQVKLLLKRTFR